MAERLKSMLISDQNRVFDLAVVVFENHCADADVLLDHAADPDAVAQNWADSLRLAEALVDQYRADCGQG